MNNRHDDMGYLTFVNILGTIAVIVFLGWLL